MKKLMDAGGSLGLNVTGSASITGGQSTKVKAGGQAAFKGSLSFSVAAGATNGTCTTSAPFVGSINGSAAKVKVEGQVAVLDGDQASVNIPGTLSGGGACTLPVTVTAQAAQAKVLGN